MLGNLASRLVHGTPMPGNMLKRAERPQSRRKQLAATKAGGPFLWCLLPNVKLVVTSMKRGTGAPVGAYMG